ncbi:hypothetical protein PIIN_01894 [Serendipita indica DSM 11827]|uniref:Uncharacterized protein n=1 Tax=Serendipita indica (strain DSM 11827) TaxID=1109443 RepID=G4T9M6_SERID|nr:hypothetical protein PIIN_01894 [Serendipita indica DSM 11827]
MADPLSIATTIAGIIRESIKVGKQLYDLLGRYKRSNLTLLCLCTEVFIIEKALVKLQAYGTENPRAFGFNDKDASKDIDCALFATSITLSELSRQLEKLGGRIEAESRPRATTLEKLKLLWREEDMKQILDHLRGQHSALQFLLTAITMESIDEIKQMLANNRPVIEHMEEEASIHSQRLGCLKALSRPQYSATIVGSDSVKSIPEDSIADPLEISCATDEKPAYPLIPELIGSGLSYQQVIDIYERSGLDPLTVKAKLEAWKTYGSNTDFRIALTALIRNNCNVAVTDDGLMFLYVLDRQLYPRTLLMLKKYAYNFTITQQRLEILMRLSEMTIALHSPTIDPLTSSSPNSSSMSRSIATDNLRRFLGSLEANMYNFAETYQQINGLINLRRLSDLIKNHNQWLFDDPQSHNYAALDTMWLVQFWEHNAYDAVITEDTLCQVMNWFITHQGVPCHIHVVLLLLRRCFFRKEVLLRSLDRLRGANDAPTYLTLTLEILAHSTDQLPVDHLVSEVNRLFKKFWTEPRFYYPPLMANKYNYNIPEMVRVEKAVESAFPSAFVETGLCWDWLMFNGFDLKETQKDATMIPDTFSSLSAEQKKECIRQMHARRSVSIKYSPDSHLFHQDRLN